MLILGVLVGKPMPVNILPCIECIEYAVYVKCIEPISDYFMLQFVGTYPTGGENLVGSSLDGCIGIPILDNLKPRILHLSKGCAVVPQ